MNADDTNHIILANAIGGAITVNLPTAVGRAGKSFAIKKIDASANTVTIDGNGAETIDGAATKVLSVQYKSYSVTSDNANWQITHEV